MRETCFYANLPVTKGCLATALAVLNYSLVPRHLFWLLDLFYQHPRITFQMLIVKIMDTPNQFHQACNLFKTIEFPY